MIIPAATEAALLAFCFCSINITPTRSLPPPSLSTLFLHLSCLEQEGQDKLGWHYWPAELPCFSSNWELLSTSSPPLSLHLPPLSFSPSLSVHVCGGMAAEGRCSCAAGGAWGRRGSRECWAGTPHSQINGSEACTAPRGLLQNHVLSLGPWRGRRARLGLLTVVTEHARFDVWAYVFLCIGWQFGL